MSTNYETNLEIEKALEHAQDAVRLARRLVTDAHSHSLEDRVVHKVDFLLLSVNTLRAVIVTKER